MLYIHINDLLLYLVDSLCLSVLQKSTITVLKFLQETIAGLAFTNTLVTDCNHLLLKIASFFDL